MRACHRFRLSSYFLAWRDKCWRFAAKNRDCFSKARRTFGGASVKDSMARWDRTISIVSVFLISGCLALGCFPLPDLPAEKFDRFVSRFKRSEVGAFTGFRQTGVDHATLGWSVFAVGDREVGDDADDSTGHLELHALAGFDACAALDGAGNH